MATILEQLLSEVGETPSNLAGLRTLDALNQIAGPVVGPINRFTGDPIINPQTGEPDYWTEAEVLEALNPIIKSLANQITTRGGRRFNRDLFDDMRQLGAMAVLSALKRGADESRRGNSFVTWIRPRIASAMRNGIKEGKEFRNTRGALNRLGAAKAPPEVQQVIGRIREIDRQPHDDIYIVNAGNPLGEFAPLVYSYGTRLLAAMESGNPEQIASVQKEIEAKRVALQETPMIPGAFTGARSTISLPHSGKERERFEKAHRGTTGLTVPGEGGEEIERPELGGSKQVRRQLDPKTGEWEMIDIAPQPGSYIDVLSNKEQIARLIAVARQGVPEAGIPTLTTQGFRFLIRLFGLFEYPGRSRKISTAERTKGRPIPEVTADGWDDRIVAQAERENKSPQEVWAAAVTNSIPESPADPEWDAGNGVWSDWVLEGYPVMGPTQIGAEFGVSAVRVSQVMKKSMDRLKTVAQHLKMTESANLDEVDYDLFLEACKSIDLAILEMVFDSRYQIND